MADRTPTIGDNGGPPLDPDPADDQAYLWRLFCWRKAHRAVWKPPCRDIVLRRVARARELGITYRDYTLELLDTGRHL